MSSTIAFETNQMLELIAIVLFSGVLFSKLSKLIHMPDVVMYILAGILIGPAAFNLIDINDYPAANQLILTFGAAYILYDGGREINLKVLNKVKFSVLSLATLGVVVSTVITGVAASKILHVDLLTGLLLGSVIASTDPSVLVPLFKTMNISKRLKQTIIAESAFNDAVGAITTLTLLGLIAGSAFSLSGTLLELLVSAGGGIAVGLAVGFPASYLIASRKHGVFSEHPSEIGLATVISAYILASHFEFSGFLAVFVVGMICGNKKIIGLWVPEEQYETQVRFKEVLTLILRMMIFILLGASIDFSILFTHLGGALLVVAVLIFISRPLSVLVSVLWDRQAKWSLKEVLYMCWVRETGVIPAALAGMMLAADVPGARIISAVTFAAIFITLTFQASTARLLAHLLKLEEAQPMVAQATTSNQSDNDGAVTDPYSVPSGDEHYSRDCLEEPYPVYLLAQ